MVVGGAATLVALGVSMSPAAITASTGAKPGNGPTSHYYIPASAETVLRGYFSKSAKPVVEIEPGGYGPSRP